MGTANTSFRFTGKAPTSPEVGVFRAPPGGFFAVPTPGGAAYLISNGLGRQGRGRLIAFVPFFVGTPCPR